MNDLLKKNRRYNHLLKRGANISKMAEIGEAEFKGNKSLLTIGSFSFIGKANIALHDKVIIGDNVCINDGVIILTASHDVFDPKWPHKKAEITIEDYVWIGTDAMILPGVRLGRGCVVGARAVVSKSVNPGEIVVGNPAKVLNKNRNIAFDYNPCEFLATNRAWLIG
ncbi:acyltransferase [Litoribaculum gwangyangense]|uniref:Acyltransferase n=1 Tax=Litoribaculum gwangyangense TaxID=1130722 RepID=A0ABP9CUB3_9FLAO